MSADAAHARSLVDRTNLRERIRVALLLQRRTLVVATSADDISTLGRHYIVDRAGVVVERDVDLRALALRLGVSVSKRAAQPRVLDVPSNSEELRLLGEARAEQLIAELSARLVSPGQAWRSFTEIADRRGCACRAASSYVVTLAMRAARVKGSR